MQVRLAIRYVKRCMPVYPRGHHLLSRDRKLSFSLGGTSATVLQEAAGEMQRHRVEHVAGGWTMADPRRRRFLLWPWRQKAATVTPTTAPPSAQDLAEKLSALVQFERGVVALYYYLPDESLARVAQTLCQSRQAANLLEQGVDHNLQAKDAMLESWSAVSVLWQSQVWQPGEILATFGVRTIEALRAESEVWSVVVDPRAQCFGLATAKDEGQRYWVVLVVGQKGQAMGGDTATAAR
jgi:hypothetical protein